MFQSMEVNGGFFVCQDFGLEFFAKAKPLRPWPQSQGQGQGLTSLDKNENRPLVDGSPDTSFSAATVYWASVSRLWCLETSPQS